MFNKGLSLDQAPPISVPYRFFLTAPIFGILIALVIIFSPYDLITNQYSNTAIALVHMFTLGMLSMIIFGAMQQMMPVLAGCVIKRATLFANIVHIGLCIGTLLFSISFLFDYKFLLLYAAIFLGISFLTFFLISIKMLFSVQYLTSTVKAMKLFAVSGLITVLLGFYIISSHILNDIPSNHYIFVNAHMIFGVFGFGVLLIMGVAFQVIPMFYVALDFPKVIQNKFPMIIFTLLFLFSIFLYFGIDIYFIKLIIATMFIIFSLYGINSLNHRKRPVFDVTLWYWKFSFVMFIISMLNWFFIPQDSPYLLAILFAFGFLYSLLQGMVYKIIPFLAWFHLSSRGYFVIPTMREMISEDLIKIHFFIYLASISFFILAAFFNKLFLLIAAILFIVSNLMFLINCIIAIKKFMKVSKSDPMDFSLPKT